MDGNSRSASASRPTRRRPDGYGASQRVNQTADQLNAYQAYAANSHIPPQRTPASDVTGNGVNGFGAPSGYYSSGGREWNSRDCFQGMPQNPLVGNGGLVRGSAAPRQNSSAGTIPGWQRGYLPLTSEEQAGFGYVPDNGRPNKKKGLPWGKIAWIVAISTVIVLAVFLGVRAQREKERRNETESIVIPYNTKYCPGVYVDGIHLGGMEPQQAYDSVINQLAQYYGAWSVRLRWNDRILYEFTAEQLGMVPQVEATLNEAWKKGHTDPFGNPLSAEERRKEMEQLALQPFVISTARADHDTSVIDSVLEQAKAYIDRPAQNAVLKEFRPENESDPFVIQDEEVGLCLDIEPVRRQLYELVDSLTNATVELVPEEILPDITRKDIQYGITLRGSATTPISRHSTEDRNNNIRRAFESVSGVILQPGKQFSFNNTVGERTTANGFFKAVEYAYGEHVEGVGGGVCQASTTIYQAAVSAGLEILKREPHSDAVSYTDYGKDATVYWNGKRKIDFVFRNNTDYPIYLVASVQKDPSNKNRLIAKVSIYGKDLGNVRYELQSTTVKILDPPVQPEYVKDKNAEYVKYTDQQKSVSKASEGYIVESYRIRYEDNTMVEKKLLYTDTYEPKPEKIYVGVTKRGK